MFNERLMNLTARLMKNSFFFYYPTFLKRFGLIVILCISTLFARGQKGVSMESAAHLGVVIKHSPELTFDVKGASVGAELNFKFQTFGKNEWEEWRNFPKFGVTAFWMRFGNESILGHAFAITPNLTIPLFDKKKWSGHFQIGTGIGYMTKKYDVVNNPKNNAIGSNITAAMLMRFYATRSINSDWKFNLGISLSHFSNGGSRLPNFGLNIPALMCGVSYTPRALQKEDYIFHKKSKKSLRKFGIDIHSGYGLVQRFAIGGPRFPVYFVAVGGNYYLNRVNRLVSGFEYEQNKAVYFFALHTGHSMTRNDAWRKASRLSFFVGDEFLFGRWSMNLQVGIYFGKFSFLRSGDFYTKFSTRFYLPNKGFLKQKIFLSFSLKTHLSVADYFGFGGGVNF